MQAPATPIDENVRLQTLRSLRILDTAPEERFDRLTRLAQRLFGVPIAMVSLVDARRQWFKSCAGIRSGGTARDISFCGHAILEDSIFLVPDASRDLRFADNPLVLGDPRVRFYAGCPLTVSNGSKIGTLCLIDSQPRQMSAADQALLRDLARMVEQEIAAVQLATMDELTLLSNRRGFQALAQRVLNVCRQYRQPASLFFFDLNRFKQINDQFGHDEGDRALSRFAECLRKVFRDSDVLGRLGGDEFVALLSNAPRGEAEARLARLRAAVAAINAGERRGYDIGFSVGVTPFDRVRHQGIGDLVREADALMYQNKRHRQEVVLAEVA